MIILKIGGGAKINLQGIVDDLRTIKEQVVIVHGANAARDQLALSVGYTRQVLTSVSGFSSVYTDRAMIELLMMSYAGLMNKRIVELCQKAGINAVGLSGLDGRLIQGKKNKGIRVQEGERLRLIHDESGKAVSINESLLHLLLQNGYTPILCIPITGEHGEALNSENDDLVCAIHASLKADQVVHLIEAPGFLSDVADERTLIPSLSRSELNVYTQKTSGRMKRKLHALEKLFTNEGVSVTIADGRVAHPLADALAGKGTVIR